MAQDKEKVQDLIDDFVVNNVDQINEVATENPVLYDAVIDALNLLSRKFGTIKAINVPKPAAPKANALHPSVTMLADFVDIKGNETRVGKIDTENEEVTFIRSDVKSRIKLKFSSVNAAIEKGDIKLKELPLNSLIKLGAQFKDTRPNKLNTFKIDEIDYDSAFVSLTDLNDNYLTSDTFARANDNIKRGIWEPVAQSKQITLNPLVVVGAKFREPNGKLIEIIQIDINQNSLDGGIITYEREGKLALRNMNFVEINYLIEHGTLVLVAQPNAPKLNALVDIDEVFEKKNGDIIKIIDIDPDKELVEYYSTYNKQNVYIAFNYVNDYIDQEEWVWKPSAQTQTSSAQTQSNTFGALTLNPSVQVGQTYLDLEDDSNFSVLQIDQKKQVVSINWNEDDIEADVDFEDFNDNLQAATWVLAPDQAQGPSTEAEILEAIEGLELIGDAESKKEITELKKQLKQLKKKKP
jgi:hypothetical protein